MGDDIMDPKQTISSKSLGIEKGFDVGRVGAKIFKSDVNTTAYLYHQLAPKE
jgi:hypothetical protein